MPPTWLLPCELPWGSTDPLEHGGNRCHRVYSDTLPRWERWALMWLDHYHGWAGDDYSDWGDDA